FFFQAEDGIRDRNVTGVQTCALPICGVFGNAVAGWRGAIFGGVLNGIVLSVGQAIGWSLYSGTAPELATLADADWYAVGWVFIEIGRASCRERGERGGVHTASREKMR